MDDYRNNNRITGNDGFFDDLDVSSGFDDDFSGEGPDVSEFDLPPLKPGTGMPEFDSFDEPEDTGTRYGRNRKPRELNTAGTAVDPKKAKAETEKKKKSRVRKIIGWAVLEIVTLCCIFGYGMFLRYWNLANRIEVNQKSIENQNISLEKKQEMEQGYWTFAVFGVDGRSASDLVSKGLNSDVIMIVNINQDTGEIRLVSVFRDTYLNINSKDTYRKINAAYANGGPEQALAALNKNLDLNIKNYVTFNWKAVADGINILGGIDGIDISKAELYYINAFITETVNVTGVGSYQLKSTGPQHLDGVQAVAYGRLRLMDNDFARTERQKRVIKAAFEKAKNSSFSVLNNIMVVCFPEVATNINFNQVVAMAQNITRYHIGENGGFPWQRSASAISSVGDVVVPATLESNVRYLHRFLYDDENYEPSAAVLRYSAEISEKTGIYKEGQVVESVRTDGGLISQPKTAAASEGESGKAKDSESTEEGEGESREKATIGIDEHGRYIYPLDENGNPYLPKDRHGNVLYPTDPDGNIIWELDEDGQPIILYDENGEPLTMAAEEPEEEPEEGDEPGEPSHGDDIREEDGPGAGTGKKKKTPGTEGPGSAATQATTEGYGPGNPQGGTGRPDETEDSSGGPGGGSTSGGGTPGPVIETTASGGMAPGSTDGPGGGSVPGGSTTGGGNAPGGGTAGGGNAPGGGTTGGGNAPGGGSVPGGNAPGDNGPGM